MESAKIAIICLGVPALFYAAQAAYYQYQQGRVGMMIAFLAYAVANIGFIIDTVSYKGCQ